MILQFRMLLRSCPALAACLVVAAASPQVGTAAPLFFSGLANSYQPGSAIEFEVGLPPMDGLGAYNVDLLLTSPSGIAGIDYFFDVGATTPSSNQYVFQSDTSFYAAVNVDAISQHRITLTDYDLDGTSVQLGQNDLIALVVVRTSPEFSQPLYISFDVNGLILDSSEGVASPVSEFEGIIAGTATIGTYALYAVPEPCALWIATAMWVLGSRITNRQFRSIDLAS